MNELIQEGSYPEGHGVGEVRDSDHQSHISVPHVPGVVTLSTAAEEVGEVGEVPDARMGKGEEGWVGGVATARPVVQFPGELSPSSNDDGPRDIGQHPETF